MFNDVDDDDDDDGDGDGNCGDDDNDGLGNWGAVDDDCNDVNIVSNNDRLGGSQHISIGIFDHGDGCICNHSLQTPSPAPHWHFIFSIPHGSSP